MPAARSVCPFCAMLCDDVGVVGEKGRLKVTVNGCPKAVAGYERPAVKAGEVEILDALHELVQEGKVRMDESGEEVIFFLI